MFIIISKDKRIPDDLKNFEYEQWSLEEFIEKATSDEGIQLDNSGGMYFNLDSVDKDMYESLRQSSDSDHNITYYKFNDQIIDMDFTIEEGYKSFAVEERKEPPKVKEPVEIPKEKEESKVVEPVIQPKIKEEHPQSNEPDPYFDDKFNMPKGINVITENLDSFTNPAQINNINNLLNYDECDVNQKLGKKPAKVILFGSSKGGTGKTFTCLIAAHRYATTHPDKKVAVADFDIIDGQVGVIINVATPTMYEFHKQYKLGNTSFDYLSSNRVKNGNFGPNLDFYLAPPVDIPEITNNDTFWTKVFEMLILNYDVVFFDSGIDYLGKAPIHKLYKIADKIIITCTPTTNSVKSVIRQFKTLGGIRKNNIFKPSDEILKRTYAVLTRVYADEEINKLVVANISQFVDIIAAFGNIDDTIAKVQWYQQWQLIANNPQITKYLDIINNIDE